MDGAGELPGCSPGQEYTAIWPMKFAPGWLPPVLRTQGLAAPALPLAGPRAGTGEEGSVAAATVLPAFLVEGDADAAEALAPYLAAAE